MEVSSLSKFLISEQDLQYYNIGITSCPTCQVKYRIKIPKSVPYPDDGMLSVVVNFPCDHKFMLYFDSKGIIRSFNKIYDVDIIVEPINKKFLQDIEAELKKIHLSFVSENRSNKAWATFNDLQKIRELIKKS